MIKNIIISYCHWHEVCILNKLFCELVLTRWRWKGPKAALGPCALYRVRLDRIHYQGSCISNNYPLKPLNIPIIIFSATIQPHLWRIWWIWRFDSRTEKRYSTFFTYISCIIGTFGLCPRIYVNTKTDKSDYAGLAHASLQVSTFCVFYLIFWWTRSYF